MGTAAGGYVDLRSDTVTRPSPAMRRSMAQAEVGDDLFGDDPTVNRLQDLAAELTGCQAALYLPTGTMCNQVAMHVFARSGHLVVCEQDAHTGGMEMSSSAVLSGIAFHRVPAAARGLLAAPQVAAALTPDPYGMAVVDLVTVENTHQVGGGSVMRRPRRGGDRQGLCRPGPAAVPGRGADLQRLHGGRCVRRRLCNARGRDDVLPVQGPRRADRLDAGG